MGPLARSLVTLVTLVTLVLAEVEPKSKQGPISASALASLPVAKFVGEGTNASAKKTPAMLLAVANSSHAFLAPDFKTPNVGGLTRTALPHPSTQNQLPHPVKLLNDPVGSQPMNSLEGNGPRPVPADKSAVNLPPRAAADSKRALDKTISTTSSPTWHIWKLWPERSGVEKLLAGITFMSMLKACCMAGNILVQISPYPQVQRWEASGCTGDSDAAPYISIAFGGWQWCYYGLFAFFVTKRSGFLILVHSNCLGAVLGTYYSWAFWRNCNHHSLGGLQRYTSAVVMLVLFQLCSLAVLPVERALFVTGLISSFCSFIGAISILVSLPRVIRTHDSSSIPALLVLANLVSSLVWCICGWMLEDPLIAAPNVVGFASGSVCLFLKYMYPDGDYSMVKRPREQAATPSLSSPRRTAPRGWKATMSYQSCDTGGTD